MNSNKLSSIIQNASFLQHISKSWLVLSYQYEFPPFCVNSRQFRLFDFELIMEPSLQTPKKPSREYEGISQQDKPQKERSRIKTVRIDNPNSITLKSMPERMRSRMIVISQSPRYSIDNSQVNPQQVATIDFQPMIERIKARLRENQNLKQRYEAEVKRCCQAEFKRKKAIEDRMKLDKQFQTQQWLLNKSMYNLKYTIQQLTSVKGNSDTQIIRVSGDIYSKDSESVKYEKRIIEDEDRLKPLIAEIQEMQRASLLEDELMMRKTQEKQLKQKTYDEKNKDFKIHNLQISVLKMQLNPYMKVSFNFMASLEDQRKVLEKGVITWNKKNIKQLSNEEMRYFIIIQLYPQWKRILNRISYHFNGYRQIFCLQDLGEKDYSPSLIEFITPSKHIRKSMSSVRSIILVYSHQDSTFQNMINFLNDLKGVQNGILNIWNVQINSSPVENVLEVTINYRFINDERVKKFQLIRLTELNRETISKLIPRGGDKIVLMKLEIPFIFSSQAELSRYQQVFELIRRYK